MKAGEESSPAKPTKPASSTQEIPATLAYPDWPMQAFYPPGATPPPFFTSTVGSPTPHYIWGQHPMMTPYGTPVQYSAIYPPGGVYAHPTMATAPNSALTNSELERKGPEVKDRASAKKFKVTPGGKTGEIGKTTATSGSGNDGGSQSGDSGSEGSSNGSDENDNQQEFGASKKGSFDQMLAEANAQSNTGETVQGSVPGKPVVSMPATNLNIGMDLWNASPAAGGAVKMRPNPSGASSAHVPTMPDQWVQDERELKRQKRKQSNRESARRSRLRKQAECEELQARVEILSSENRNLRDELQRLSEDCEKLASENGSIKEELERICGPEAVAKLEQNNPNLVLQSRGDEGQN